ncbi:MAG TPA: metal ABC transporter ATP-binding protein [Clostridiales bacterium]|nr:metal ABC transporter ATP-binding protein [Clostridiales bacterium]HQP70347.1 metal ABC transporter ATP-binding protein [Clostridiales bacterium]
MNEPILEIKNITAGYNGTRIIENINLTVYENDFLGIIGPNGGGKSTLLKVIVGLLKPEKGEVIFKKKSRFGYLPQFTLNDSKFPITVKNVVLSGLVSEKKVFQKFSQEDHDKAEKILNEFGLLQYKDSPFGELSGGQIQRTFLCRAIVSDPDILFLDEPTAFTDKDFSKNLFKTLLDINSDTTIIMVTHETGIISSYVKNIACINRTLHYHPGNEITEEIIDKFSCPVEIITHGKFPHRVLMMHKDGK